jgi:hypothetical protein
MSSLVDVEGTDTSKKSGVDDCDSAQAGEMAIGVRIPTKLAINSRKEARIGIYEDLNRLYHAWPKSVNGRRQLPGEFPATARETWISPSFPAHLEQE